MGADKEVILLLSKGADPNKAAIDGEGYVITPLYLAFSSIELVKGLLASGADPNKGQRRTREDGSRFVRTPLYEAAVYGSTEVVKSLLENGARQDLDTGGGELG